MLGIIGMLLQPQFLLAQSLPSPTAPPPLPDFKNPFSAFTGPDAADKRQVGLGRLAEVKAAIDAVALDVYAGICEPWTIACFAVPGSIDYMEAKGMSAAICDVTLWVHSDPLSENSLGMYGKGHIALDKSYFCPDIFGDIFGKLVYTVTHEATHNSDCLLYTSPSPRDIS